MGVVTVPDTSQRSWSTARIWVGVPPRNKNFTGRTDILEQLRHRTAGSKPAVLLSKESLPRALQGLGGVGKTAVAIEYAYKYGADYDLVCWIRADQTPLIRSSLAGLAEYLGLPAPSASGIDLTTRGVLDALRRGEPYSRWLLIFDNADQPEELLPFIPGGPGDVLITSRNHRWGPVVDTIPLDVFERAESVQFLLKRVPKRLAEADADRLAESLGDLPLALEQAGAVLYESGMSVDEYLRLLEERTAEILAQGIALEYPTSMTAAWQISVAQLRQQSPQALELLRCCAFLGPEPIPRDVFKLGSQESRTGVGALIADPIELSTAISVLGRFALVKMDGPYITVHRLIQALLRAELEPAEQGRYRQDAHSILAVGAPGNPDRCEDLAAVPGSGGARRLRRRRTWRTARCPRIAPSPLTWCGISTFPATSLLAGHSPSDSSSSGPRTRAPPIPTFLTPIVTSATRSGNSATRPRPTRPSKPRCAVPSEFLSRATPSRCTCEMLSAPTCGRAAISPAALALDEETRALHEEIFGPTDPQTLRVMNNLALDYGLNSRYVEARELHKDVYVRQRDAKPDVSATEVLNSLDRSGQGRPALRQFRPGPRPRSGSHGLRPARTRPGALPDTTRGDRPVDRHAQDPG